MRVGQQSSVASVNGVGEGGEGSMSVGQQSSSVASVSGVGEGGEGSVRVGQQSSLCVVSGVYGDGMGMGGVGEGGEGSVSVGQQSSSSVASVNGVGEGGEGSVSSGVGDGEAEGGSVSVHERDVEIEQRDTDLEEENKVTQFCSNGCGCSLKCSFHFSLEHIRLMRANVAQLDRLALDMTIMSQIMAFTICSQTSLHSTKHRHQLKERERCFTIRASECVKKHSCSYGEFRFRALKIHYLIEGLVPRIHGYAGRTAPNALVLEDVRGTVLFVLQYVETNGILLPCRIPGYKRDDIQLLPSSTTKWAVWMLYQDSATGVRPVAYSTFCHVWRNFLGHVVVCKPTTDLCATCQKNNAAIIRSSNMAEEDKPQVSVEFVQMCDIHVNTMLNTDLTKNSRLSRKQSTLVAGDV